MVQRILPSILLAGLIATAFVPTSLSAATPDELPPPPTDGMMLPPGGDMLPPPPGDDMAPPPMGGDLLPPPPGGGDTMAPPAMDGGMPPPPGGDMMAPPAMDGGMPPPPGGDMMAPPVMDGGMPPPPGGDMMAPPVMGGDLLPPPGGDMLAPPGELAPPPADNMFPEAAPAPVASGSSDSYTVVRGNSLWKIAGKSKIYGDSFQWPLLFIGNRDKIKDPDLIKPGWDLVVKRNVAADQVAQAVQKAKDTPRYQPHTAPRKKLPIDY